MRRFNVGCRARHVIAESTMQIIGSCIVCWQSCMVARDDDQRNGIVDHRNLWLPCLPPYRGAGAAVVGVTGTRWLVSLLRPYTDVPPFSSLTLRLLPSAFCGSLPTADCRQNKRRGRRTCAPSPSLWRLPGREQSSLPARSDLFVAYYRQEQGVGRRCWDGVDCDRAVVDPVSIILHFL